MRQCICLIVLFGVAVVSGSTATGLSADDALVADDAIHWGDPLGPISATEADDKLVLLLITNDEPIRVDDAVDVADGDDQRAAVDAPNGVYGWCTDVFADAFRELRHRRPDLRSKLMLQWLPAGLPRELTGGKVSNGTARAVVLLCDGHYRLASFLVGVPDADDLLTLIEDGQEFQRLRSLDTQGRQRVVANLAGRSSQRMDRLWRQVLEESVVAMDGAADDRGGVKDRGIGELEPDFSYESFDQVATQRMLVLNERFGDMYLADVRLRFGLTEASDVERLVTLEQHIQTRRPWCEAMIPFIAGIQVDQQWPTLVELIWGHPAIRGDFDASELVQQIKTLGKDETFVFSIQPPTALRNIPWPPISDDTSGAGAGWQRVQELATKTRYREVDWQQLAAAIRGGDLTPIDVRGNSLLRYVILPAGKTKPLPVFQNSPPGRVVGLLKRFNR
ncbi:hypothetical protein K227x_61080 [Rubripirellula lacrimiformis]|uniref:Secreted protein n=1 Tax=Rubripirellula lacrimiformis TaxID=1930273 RepID=A0A517NKM9_9BACT|nr:hypothetical protein [Rubripirellula lacrimiformis]QDT07680.1 hypothetical protein K227x_61080 [Rubripirellula lacrimiformis]